MTAYVEVFILNPYQRVSDDYLVKGLSAQNASSGFALVVLCLCYGR